VFNLGRKVRGLCPDRCIHVRESLELSPPLESQGVSFCQGFLTVAAKFPR